MWGVRGVYVHMSADAHEDWRYKCCEPLDFGCWEPSSDPLQEQLALLSTQPFLQSL